MQAYHQKIATHFNLHPYIHFNHSLESAYWVGNSSKGFWELSISTGGHREEVIPLNGTSAHNLRRRSRITKHFEHLVVASGHLHYPKFPPWATGNAAKEWLWNAKGRSIIHSIYFREPEEYTDKVILVVGGGASGVDIAAQLTRHAKKVCPGLYPPLWSEMGDKTAVQVYISFTDHGDGEPLRNGFNAIRKPRTKGFTPSSVQFEDGTEVSDVEVVFLATGYEYRFPFLDPSDPYNQPTQDIPYDRRAILTTNASANSRSEGEPRLTENHKYLFPIDRHITSLSSFHPLNALLFIGLQYRTIYAPCDIAQGIFAGHLISQPDRVYPTSHITGSASWNETLARELLLKNLTSFENRLADEGFDLYRIGHKMNLGWYTENEYQDSLIGHLQSQGLVPRHNRGYLFVEPWRIRARKNTPKLLKIWKGIERRGEVEVKRWLDGVETEDEWADLMDRLMEWGEEYGYV